MKLFILACLTVALFGCASADFVSSNAQRFISMCDRNSVTGVVSTDKDGNATFTITCTKMR